MDNAIDLLLKVDDDLVAVIRRGAATDGLSPEEWLRKVLKTNVGLPYELPTPDYDAVMRPMVTLDLRA